MIILSIQTFFLIFLSIFSGYGFLGFCCYFFKIKPSSVNLHLTPTIAFTFGSIPFALTYTLLGIVNHLELKNFVAVIFIFLGLGCHLFGWQIIIKNIRLRTLIPDRLTILVTIFLIPMLIYGIGISLLPTSNWDAISYVLSFPKTHISEGNIRYLSEYGIFSAFPLYGEALIGSPLLLFGSEKLVQIYTFLFFINILFISRRLFKEFSSSGLFLFLLLITIGYLPIVLINIGIAKVEIPQAAIILTSILLLNIGEKKHRNFLKFLSMVLFTFGIGIKYTTIFYLPIYIFAYFVTEKKKDIKQIFIDGIQFIFIGGVINTLWIYSNFIEHCNALFPNLIKYFGSCRYSDNIMLDIMTMVWESTFLQKGTSLQATGTILGYFPFFIDSLGLINSGLIFLIFINYIFFYSEIKYAPQVKYICYGILISIIIQVIFLLWEFRYYLFVLILAMIFVFILLSNICNNIFSRIIISGLVLLQIYYSFSMFHSRNSYIFLPLKNQISIEDYKEKWIHLYWVAKYINENTAHDSVVAFNWGVQPFFYLERKYFFIHDWNPEGRTQEMHSVKEFYDLLLQKNCSFIVWRNQDEARYQDPSISKKYHAKMNSFLLDLVEKGNIVQILHKDDVTIYSIIK